MKQRNVAASAALMVVCLLAGTGSAAAQSLPAPWKAADVGSPAATGSVTYVQNAFEIDAAGADIGYQSDEFYFIYQEVTGDVDIRAKVEHISMVHSSSKAGVMIRESLAPNAAHGMALVKYRKDVNFDRRPTTGAKTKSSYGPQNGTPIWLRLVRKGNAITAYWSGDGSNWTSLGSDTVTMGEKAFVGIAVASHDTAQRTTVAVSGVSVNGSSGTPTPPPTALPAGQTAADIGTAKIAGQTTYAPSTGTYTIKAAGGDIWGNADQFHYVYQPVDGDVEVIARMVSIADVGDAGTKAGVMIRGSLEPNAPHVSTMAFVGGESSLQARLDVGAKTQKKAGPTRSLPMWVRLVRKGLSVTSYQSNDGASWTKIGSVNLPVDTTVFVGIAVTSDTPEVATTVTVDNFKVIHAGNPVNRPPTVVLSAPTNGATYTTPASITITASASDADGSITSVEFYANGTLLAKDNSAPYSVTGTLQEGSYAITAVAYDNAGASTVSAVVNVTVKAAPQSEEPKNPPAAAPAGVAFTVASSTHAAIVEYVLEVHKAGQTPGATAPTASVSLGKPVPDSKGEIVVMLSSFFQGLPSGNYIATVVAKNTNASARSSAVSFSR
jgi:regulation of enolase protein 1 (concanavalin A-like superfamily)